MCGRIPIFKPSFSENPDNSKQKSFPFPSQTFIHFYHRFHKLPEFSKQFSFPLKVGKIGVVYHLQGVTVWVTVWANGKPKPRTGITNEIWRVSFTGIYSEGLELT